MPELPEVETMVRGIRDAAETRTIEHVEFVAGTCRPITVVPGVRQFVRRVSGRTIHRVSRIAKRVVLELDSRESIVIEPRMTGLMLVAEPPTREHRRVVWHLKPKRHYPESIEFWDRRGLGTLSLLTQRQITELQGRLGPDALEMSDDMWLLHLAGTNRPVKVALLDQTLVAGIGNLYASEILHEAGVSPRQHAMRLSRAQVLGVAHATRRILSEAIRYEGSTLGDGTYRNALNNNGSYQSKHRVYQRAGQPCTYCLHGQIRRIVQAQRSTLYCPKCQTAAASRPGIPIQE